MECWARAIRSAASPLLGVDGLVGGDGVGDPVGDLAAVLDADDGQGVRVEGCFRAFCAELALPSAVFGPVDSRAWARVVATCSEEVGMARF
jgi:hypothetical protein